MNSEFSRNVSSQILGTGIAQLLPFLATPLLTRLFSEKDFALYTSFFALATIYAVGAGGKYQMAIVLPKRKQEALRIFSLSIYLTIGYSAILTIGFIVFYDFASMNIGRLIYFVPLYVLLFGIWSALTNLSIREKTFKNNAYAKVIQSLVYIVSAIGIGLSKITINGLVLAKITGIFASGLFLYKMSKLKGHYIKIKKLKTVAKKYMDYPKYGVAPAFLNTISAQALILVLAKYYTTEDLGYYGLTYMVLSAPLGLIGTSFKDVFYEKIASLINHERFEEALIFFRKSAKALFFMGLPVCLMLYLFGTDLFAFIFGNKWSQSGEFASILAISFLIKLVISPLSSIFNAANRLKIASIWQVIYFISTFLTLGICSYILELEITELLVVYVVHEMVLYSFYFFLEYKTLNNFIKNSIK